MPRPGAPDGRPRAGAGAAGPAGARPAARAAPQAHPRSPTRSGTPPHEVEQSEQRPASGMARSSIGFPAQRSGAHVPSPHPLDQDLAHDDRLMTAARIAPGGVGPRPRVDHAPDRFEGVHLAAPDGDQATGGAVGHHVGASLGRARVRHRHVNGSGLRLGHPARDEGGEVAERTVGPQGGGARPDGPLARPVGEHEDAGVHLHEVPSSQPTDDAARAARPDHVDASGDAGGQEGGESVHGAEGVAAEPSAAEALWMQPTVERRRTASSALLGLHRSTVTGWGGGPRLRA